MKKWVFALADDLTGALETGAKFAGQGIEARVTTEHTLREAPNVPVLVIDTETRHLPKQEAAAVIRKIAAQAHRFSPWLIYKKTDSTLRGHIAAEFQALVDIFPERELIYAPAYPDMGRTARDGRLYIHGIPVHQTAFAADSLNPVLESEFATLLAGVPATVHDGESNADVHAAARAILAQQIPPLAAGPAALAGALAESLQLPRTEPKPLPHISHCLIVNGSQHPTSHAQIAYHTSDDNWRHVQPQTNATGEQRATQTGEQIRAILQSSPTQALIVFGGDTAYGIHRALGSHPFEALGEVLPGVPISRSHNFFWITKAGGFGTLNILCDIRKRLT